MPIPVQHPFFFSTLLKRRRFIISMIKYFKAYNFICQVLIFSIAFRKSFNFPTLIAEFGSQASLLSIIAYPSSAYLNTHGHVASCHCPHVQSIRPSFCSTPLASYNAPFQDSEAEKCHPTCVQLQIDPETSREEQTPYCTREGTPHT